MIDKNQKVEVSWNPSTKQHYINKGYVFTKMKSRFRVKVGDLQLGSRTKVNVKCDYCNMDKVISYELYQRTTKNETEKYACNNCRTAKYLDYYIDKSLYFQKYIDICNKNNYTPLSTINDYVNRSSHLKFICPIHGEQSLSYMVFMRSQNCPKCSIEIRTEKRRHTQEDIIKIIESQNNNKLLNPQEYIRSTISNLKILCGSCNQNIFTVSLSNYLTHDCTRCSTCAHSLSRGERLIQKVLNEYNIQYISQKTFINCKDKRNLPFDIYLPEYNICIEFDGRQHYQPVFGQDNFNTTQIHDSIKTNYCKDNNIKLIRIPYWEGHHIEEILIRELNLQQTA